MESEVAKIPVFETDKELINALKAAQNKEGLFVVDIPESDIAVEAKEANKKEELVNKAIKDFKNSLEIEPSTPKVYLVP